jgi:hypothetical protein
MGQYINKHIVIAVAFTFVLYITPHPAWGGDTLVAGKSSADEAAEWRAPTTDTAGSPRLSTAMAGNFGATYAQPDTTVFEFPEEENKHLIRDITVFVIAAAFVGYFLVKVFLEGDTEEEEEEDNGKTIPGGQ